MTIQEKALALIIGQIIIGLGIVAYISYTIAQWFLMGVSILTIQALALLAYWIIRAD